MSNEVKTEFEKASDRKDSNVAFQFLAMLKQNKKFWLLPMVVGLVALGLLIILGGTGAAPFIYSLF
jgi:hypothetical protein